jgi:hypothetical protein
MKSPQLEILLLTDTRFSSRQFSEKYDTGNKKNAGKYKSLEEAGWNGLFSELLPELYGKKGNSKKLILWNVTQAEHFLELEYSVQPQEKERFSSVNPYFFLDSRLLS